MHFHVPMILSVHIPLGASFGPDGWRAPVTPYGGSYTKSYLTTPSARLRPDISACVNIDPFIRRFVRQSSFSPWVFFRPPAYWQHCPLDRFRCISTTAAFCRLYRASDVYAPVGVSGRMLPGVTRSFHPLDHQFYINFHCFANSFFAIEINLSTVASRPSLDNAFWIVSTANCLITLFIVLSGYIFARRIGIMYSIRSA